MYQMHGFFENCHRWLDGKQAAECLDSWLLSTHWSIYIFPSETSYTPHCNQLSRQKLPGRVRRTELTRGPQKTVAGEGWVLEDVQACSVCRHEWWAGGHRRASWPGWGQRAGWGVGRSWQQMVKQSVSTPQHAGRSVSYSTYVDVEP